MLKNREKLKGQVEKGASPLEDKPRSIAEAKRRRVILFDSKGVKKLANKSRFRKNRFISQRVCK